MRDRFAALPAKLNLFRLLARSPGTFVPMMDLTQAIFDQLTLSKAHAELVTLRTGASYEWRQHLGTAPKSRVRPERIRALAEGRLGDRAVFDDDERAVLRVADELLRDGEVSPATLADAQRHFGPARTLEVLLVAGFYQMLAGVIRSVALDFNPQAAEALAQSK